MNIVKQRILIVLNDLLLTEKFVNIKMYVQYIAKIATLIQRETKVTFYLGLCHLTKT